MVLFISGEKNGENGESSHPLICGSEGGFLVVINLSSSVGGGC